MEPTWQQQVVIFECLHPQYSMGPASACPNHYSAGFQTPNGLQAAVRTKAMVWIELYDFLPQGRPERN